MSAFVDVDSVQRWVLAARKHGGVLTSARPASWHTPDQATTCDTSRYGKAEALAWDRMHPRLTARGPWLDHCGNSR